MVRNLDDIIHILNNNLLFEGIPDEILREIADAVRDETFSAGIKIFRQHEEGHKFYIIQSGRVRVYKETKIGVEIDLNELGPGDEFGEMALAADRPRAATIQAIEETHLLVLDRAQFEAILENHPRMYVNVVKYLSEMLDHEELRLVDEKKKEYEAPKLTWVSYLVIFVITFGIALIYNYSNPNGMNIIPKFYDSEAVAKVSLLAAKEKYDSKDVVFIDARPSNFYGQKHIENAINLPLPLFDIMYMMEGLSEMEMDKEIVIYGRSISAYYDEDVAKKLDLRGHKNILIMKDGWSQWKKAGYPVVSDSNSE